MLFCIIAYSAYFVNMENPEYPRLCPVLSVQSAHFRPQSPSSDPRLPLLRIDFSVSIRFIESRLSYPLRHFVTPPLTIRGGIKGARTTSPCHKGRHGSALSFPMERMRKRRTAHTMGPLRKSCRRTPAPHLGALVQKKLSAKLTEGLSRLPNKNCPPAKIRGRAHLTSGYPSQTNSMTAVSEPSPRRSPRR